MWFVLSVITAIAWGGSDLFSKMGTAPKDKTSHWKMIIVVGFVMGIHATVFLLTQGIFYSPMNIIKYLPVSGMYILSMTFGYAGLRYIELSLSSPVCNSSGAITAILCFLFLNQRMTFLQLLAVGMICASILMISILQKKEEDKLCTKPVNRKYTRSFLAIIFPILYCIIDGIGSFMDAIYLEHYMTEEEANLSYEFTFLIIAVLALGYLIGVKKEKFRIADQKVKGIAALCETAGQFTYVYAMAANAIVAAPLIASYSVFSILLSRIFLKEKLDKKYYMMIAVVMIGIAILGID